VDLGRCILDVYGDIVFGVPKYDNKPWLPVGFSFLSGLPEAARKRRLLMPVQAFVDESGGKDQGRHFVMAGLIGHSESWALFSDEWRACLDQSPRLRYFKMREAASPCTGQFHGFSESQRDNRLRALARIINRYARILTYSVIDLQAHADTWGKCLPKPQNDPYFYPFQNTIMATCFELADIGWRERFEIFFDEQKISGLRAKAWYPMFRAAAQYREPVAASILPVEPMFRTDDEFLPLQAADLFAWCLRRGTNTPDDQPFSWLLEELRSVQLSKYAQYYDRERMSGVLEQSERIQRDEGLVREMTRIYAELEDKRS
jgi:hypothetical protein